LSFSFEGLVFGFGSKFRGGEVLTPPKGHLQKLFFGVGLLVTVRFSVLMVSWWLCPIHRQLELGADAGIGSARCPPIASPPFNPSSAGPARAGTLCGWWHHASLDFRLDVPDLRFRASHWAAAFF